MKQQHKITTKKLNSFKIMMLIMLVFILLSSSYLIIKKLYHKRHDYIKQTVELPSIDDEMPEQEEDDGGWKTLTTKSGDTLGKLFTQLGLSQQTLQAVLKNNRYAKHLTSIKLGQQIQFLIHDQVLEKIMFPFNATEFLIVSKEQDQYQTKIKTKTMDSHEEYVSAIVHGSLYGTAQNMHIPYKLIQQMIEIFSWEINFRKEVHPGDQFTILYKAFYVDDTLVSTGEILAVSYTTREKTHQAIRYTSAAGNDDYFTPEGYSMRKAFSRYPIRFSHISSTYNRSRYHPVLHYSRPHKGVDLAAPIGTPIHATGDGRVQIIGRQNGYGNMIKIVHDRTYASIYGHLLKFEKGLSRGNHVKRGQVIGYVGQSGLATGPHCHYEFHVNQQPQNPTTVKLPHASPIGARENAAFRLKTQRVLASLKLFEASKMVAAKNPKMNTG